MSNQQMQQAMEDDGLQPAQSIIDDGLFHRADDTTGKPGNKLIGYVCYGNAGYYCHWSKMPEGRKWSVKREVEFTPEERKQYAIQMQLALEARRREEERRHFECRERSAIIWDNAPFAKDDHPYLLKCEIRCRLDTQSGFSWTLNPELTGQSIRY
jgi:hypothetical protein